MRKGQKKKVKLRKQQQENATKSNSETKTVSYEESLALTSENNNTDESSTDTVANSNSCRSDPEPSSKCSSERRKIRAADLLAMEGNTFYALKQFEESARKFTEAIAINPIDIRLYGNRCAAYEQMGKYVEALADAEKCIEINASWPKGYYRKGTVLKKLGEYKKAEDMFDRVLFFNRNCQEARTERMDVMTEQLVEMGYPRVESRQLLQEYDCVSKAKIVLNKLFQFNERRSHECKACPTYSTSNLDDDPLIDSKNPLKRTTLWVGNITATVKLSDLQNLFSRNGKVLSINLLNDRRCAFVNFTKWQDAGRAMAQLQGYKLANANLLLKYPDRSSQTCNRMEVKQRKVPNPYNGALPNGECYFYRTTGCFHNDHCKWKHIPANKGVDLKPWMIKRLLAP